MTVSVPPISGSSHHKHLAVVFLCVAFVVLVQAGVTLAWESAWGPIDGALLFLVPFALTLSLVQWRRAAGRDVLAAVFVFFLLFGLVLLLIAQRWIQPLLLLFCTVAILVVSVGKLMELPSPRAQRSGQE